MKTALIIIGFVVLTLVFIMGLAAIGVQNGGNDMENNVIAAVGQCKVVENEEMKKVLDMLVVTDKGHQYVQGLIDSLASGTPSREARQAKDEYDKLVAGDTNNTQGLVGVLVTAGIVSSTDFLTLDKQVMNSIEGGRNRLRDCKQMMVEQQNNYRKAIGMDASGRLSSFPNGMVAGWLGFPHQLPPTARVRPETDWDGDGRFTVLDFQPPVLPEIMQKYNEGTDSGGGWVK